jgi:hypothetical protein
MNGLKHLGVLALVGMSLLLLMNPGALTPVSAQSGYTPPAGLVSAWRADGNANDSVGGNNGTMLGSVTFGPGIAGQAFQVGNGSYVTIPGAPNLDFGQTSPITVNAWVFRTSDSDTQHILGKRTSDCGVLNYQMYYQYDYVGFGGNDAASLSFVLSKNTWYHLAGTFDGSTFSLYINGELKATAPGTLGPVVSSDLEIGNSGACANGWFGGLIDEVEIYNRALSSSEILAIFNARSIGGVDPALNGCYVYAPNAVNEGDTFRTTVKCHAITSQVFGFQFGTTFTPTMVARNGVPNLAVAEQVGTTYTSGSFVLATDLLGVNSLNGLYAVSHTGTDTSTGDFTLGTFDASVPLGITADSSAMVDLRDLKLADRNGADIAANLPQSHAIITITNLVVAQREVGTLHVASDGAMTTVRAMHLNLDDGAPLDVATAPGSYHDFSVTAYQYPVGKQSADIAISMLSHLSCTRNASLADGLNPASVLGTTYTVKAGDANADGNIDLNDATLVGGYFGTSRTDSADISGDGTVDIYDLVHIGRNYNATSGTCS